MGEHENKESEKKKPCNTFFGISFNFSNEHKESVGSGVQTAEQQLPTMLRIAVHYAINIDELK